MFAHCGYGPISSFRGPSPPHVNKADRSPESEPYRAQFCTLRSERQPVKSGRGSVWNVHRPGLDSSQDLRGDNDQQTECGRDGPALHRGVRERLLQGHLFPNQVHDPPTTPTRMPAPVSQRDNDTRNPQLRRQRRAQPGKTPTLLWSSARTCPPRAPRASTSQQLCAHVAGPDPTAIRLLAPD
jgi:hypothetical protein